MPQVGRHTGAYGVATDPREDWRKSAVCRGYDPEWWVVERGNAAVALNNQRAVEICRQACPMWVQEKCLAFGIEKDAFGLIHGGKAIERVDGQTVALGFGSCAWCRRPFVRLMSSQRYCRGEHRDAAEAARYSKARAAA